MKLAWTLRLLSPRLPRQPRRLARVGAAKRRGAVRGGAEGEAEGVLELEGVPEALFGALRNRRQRQALPREDGDLLVLRHRHRVDVTDAGDAGAVG